MKESLALLTVIVLAVFLFSMDNKTKEKEKDAVLADSELALLMRDMHLEAKALRLAIQNKETLHDFNLNNDFILNATPTKANVKGQEFDAMARYYLQKSDSLSQFQDKESYNDMVESCIVCHQAFCPGPVKTIKKLNIN